MAVTIYNKSGRADILCTTYRTLLGYHFYSIKLDIVPDGALANLSGVIDSPNPWL